MTTTILSYSIDLQLLGILFDIVGAYLLARSFIVKSPADIKNEVYGNANQNFQIPYGMSDNLFFSFLIQGEEAKHGLIMLTVGFLGQAIAILSSIEIPLYLFILVFVSSCIGIVVSYRYRTRKNRLIELHDRDERLYDNRLKRQSK